MFSFTVSMGGCTGVTSVVETTALRKRRKRRSKHKIIKYRRENNLPLSLSQEKYRKRQNRRARDRWRKRKKAERTSRNDSSIASVLLLVKKAVRSVFTRTPAPSNTTAVLHQEPESTQNDEGKSQCNDYFLDFLTTAFLTTSHHFVLAYSIEQTVWRLLLVYQLNSYHVLISVVEMLEQTPMMIRLTRAIAVLPSLETLVRPINLTMLCFQ